MVCPRRQGTNKFGARGARVGGVSPSVGVGGVSPRVGKPRSGTGSRLGKLILVVVEAMGGWVACGFRRSVWRLCCG